MTQQTAFPSHVPVRPLYMYVVSRMDATGGGDDYSYVEFITPSLERAHAELNRRYPKPDGWFNADTEDVEQGEDEYWEDVVARLPPMFRFERMEVVL